MKKKSNKGISLIEVLVTLGILLIMFGVGTPFYTSYHSRNVLSRTTQEIAEELRKVQIESMAGLSGQDLGIHFESDRYIFFEGGTYSGLAEGNVVYPVSNKVTIETANFSGEPNVLFYKPSGDATAGYIILRSVDGALTQISVSDVGAVDISVPSTQ